MAEPETKASSYISPLGQPMETKPQHLKAADLFRLSLRIFKVKPLRTLFTILAMSVGIGAVIFLVSLGYGLQSILLGKLASTEDSLVTLDAYYPSENAVKITQERIDATKKYPEVAEISPVAEFSGEAKTDAGVSGLLLVRVIEPSYFRLSGTVADVGTVLSSGDKKSVVSNTALQLLNLVEEPKTIGTNVIYKIFFEGDEKSSKAVEISQPLPISGIMEDPSGQPFAFILADAEAPPPFYQHMLVKAKDLESVEPLRDKLVTDGFLISARIDLVNQAQKILTVITFVLGIFGATALTVSAIGMLNTMVIGFLERIFEVGIMKSIGATASDIRNLFLMEALVTGLLGGVGGILIGVGASQIFNLALNLLARYLGGKPISIFVYPMRLILAVLALSGVVGLLAGFFPARRASNLSPKEAFIR